MVLAIYVGLAAAGAFLLMPSLHVFLFIGWMVALTLLMCAVCWIKGEKPRWRWGGK